MAPSSAILLPTETGHADEPLAQSIRFASRWLSPARRAIGRWIVYQNARGYHATARIDRIEPDGAYGSTYRAVMVESSFLEFGRVVPLEMGGLILERGLDTNGSLDGVLASHSVRIVPDEEFDRIVDLGLIDADDLLPRSDDAFVVPGVAEERMIWDGPVDRATVLTNRKVRDRQFRRRVLDAYGARCALTGMKLINGRGRVETEAAHIKSVEAGGPDAVENGIALSGTIHWMFDRGLISLSDSGEILLSRAINDRESVERLIHSDGRARFPVAPGLRPHPSYLEWHRTLCFHD